jgi:NAD-dependent deacetylase
MKDQVEQVAQWMLRSRRTVIFTGAGLSTESGIPDFRSPGGVWERYDPGDFDFQNFLTRESSREKYWQMASEIYRNMKAARPNTAHLAIAELERMGRLDCVITQNIDGLHVRAGHSKGFVIELHGTAMSVSCLSCGVKADCDDVERRLKRGEKVPRCGRCGGLLKPDTVSFGQAMPERETDEAYRRSARCDLFVVIGSSLVVQPAAAMPVVGKQNGARLVIVNRDVTPCDDMADLVIRGQAGEVMPAVVRRVRAGLGLDEG